MLKSNLSALSKKHVILVCAVEMLEEKEYV